MKSTVRAVTLLFLASCGKSGGTSGDSIPFEKMAGELKKVLCEKVYTCCSAAERMDNDEIGTDSTSCQDKLDGETTYLLGDVAASIQGGRVAYHGDRMATCLAAIKARSCDEAKNPADDMIITELCDGVFESKVPVGGACSEYWDCIGGWCEGDMGGLRDKCAPRHPDGGDCDEGNECQSGMCDEIARVCVKPPAGSGNICKLGTVSVGQHIGQPHG